MSVPILTLREAVQYNPETGMFIWKSRPIHHFSNDARWSAGQAQKRWNTRYAGKPAFFTESESGYMTGVIDGIRIYAHRAAIAIVIGEWPSETVDHVNGNKADNRSENLRLANRHEQARNTSAHHNSTSKYLGVSYRTERKKWRAVIFVAGKQKYLGSFTQEADAARAYDVAAQEHFGNFAKLNFPPHTRTLTDCPHPRKFSCADRHG